MQIGYLSVFYESLQNARSAHQLVFWCEEWDCGAIRLTFCHSQVLPFVQRKVHEDGRESPVLPLQACEAEFAVHGEVLDFDDTEFPCRQFVGDGADGDDAQTVGTFQKMLDAFRAAQVEQDVEGGKADVVGCKGFFYHVECSRTDFA